MPPLSLLFSDPVISMPDVAPGGRYLAYLAPVDGVLNLWLRETSPDAVARPLTHSPRAIRSFFWAWNGRQVVYRVDPAGDERYRYFALDVDSGQELAIAPEFGRDGHRITAFGKGFYMNSNTSPADPDEILLQTDELQEKRNDLWRISLSDGTRMLVQTGLPEVKHWLVDHTLCVRGYLRGEDDGGNSLWLRDTEDGAYSERLRFAADDIASYLLVEFSADNGSIYLLDSTGRDTKALVAINLHTLERKVLAADDAVDASGIVCHPTTFAPLATLFFKNRFDWAVLDDGFKSMLELVSTTFGDGAYPLLVPDSELVLVVVTNSNAPVSLALLDTRTRATVELGSTMPQLAGYRFAEVQPVTLRARDGLPLHCYLTLPAAYSKPGPLVLLVHGGPAGRDYWGFDPVVQWLAARGYAVLQVNFRGSTGFGKRFQAAGDRQWGAAMQDDLSDAVVWATAQGLADPQHVAIMGLSYGGYAVLAGLTLTPELYAAGVALNPVSDLETDLRHWDTIRAAWRVETERRVGSLPRYAD